jgi:hypothetical protein
MQSGLRNSCIFFPYDLTHLILLMSTFKLWRSIKLYCYIYRFQTFISSFLSHCNLWLRGCKKLGKEVQTNPMTLLPSRILYWQYFRMITVFWDMKLLYLPDCCEHFLRSDLGVSVLSMCNVVHCSFIIHYFTTCSGLNDNLQMYRLLYFRTLLLTVMQFSFSCCFSLSGLHAVVFDFVQFTDKNTHNEWLWWLTSTQQSSCSNKNTQGIHNTL